MANSTRSKVRGNNGVAAGLELVSSPKPEFDFSNLSWKESKEMDYARAIIRRGESEADPDVMEEGFAAMQTLLAKIVVSMPRSWLVTDAPDEVDWDDPESFDYLQGPKMQDLMKAYTEAMAEQRKK